ncbi:Zinc finger CCHC-type protein [Dioscorea alata]|uniref:Zinc finger CCHC-type protein n=1 Tax=Dioscorea alata TaxID=55571 RepID=A0ACB7V3B1_DIOAL|nr:Zinc finger CCHC-type protein [Dioscorea alata]
MADSLLGELLGSDGGPRGGAGRGTRGPVEGGARDLPPAIAASSSKPKPPEEVAAKSTQPTTSVGPRGGVKLGLSYSQAALSPVAEDPVSRRGSGLSRPPREQEWVVVRRGGGKRKIKNHGPPGRCSSGSSSSAPTSERPAPRTSAKRRRSPESPSQPCSRCFRVGHRADECRHEIVCLCCSRAGHTAASCQLSPRSRPGDGSRSVGHASGHCREAKSTTSTRRIPSPSSLPLDAAVLPPQLKSPPHPTLFRGFDGVFRFPFLSPWTLFV